MTDDPITSIFIGLLLASWIWLTWLRSQDK